MKIIRRSRRKLVKRIKRKSERIESIVKIQSLLREKLLLCNQPPDLKSWRARYGISFDILITEQTYVHCLNCLTDIYLKSLSQLPEDILPQSTLTTIFSNIEVIKKFNLIFLNELQSRLKQYFKNDLQ